MRVRVAILVVIALVAAACGDDDSPAIPFGSSSTTSGAAGERYSDAIRESYLEGCMEDGNRAFCECTLTELEGMFTETEFIRFAIQTTEEMPPEALEIAFTCLELYGEDDTTSSTKATTATTKATTTTTTTTSTATTLPSGTALPQGVPYSGFELITDESGALEVSVPVEWFDHNLQAWDYNSQGTVVGAAITAAPDAAAWASSWGIPGVFIGASNQLGMTAEQLLDDQYFGEPCVFEERQDYDDGEYIGLADWYSNCGGVGSEFYVIAAEPYGGGALVLVQMIATTQADYVALDEITATFRVVGDLGG